MYILFSTKSMAIKVSVLVVSIVFAFSVLFLAFPAKAFATGSESEVSAEETSVDDITVEEEQVQDEGFPDAGDVEAEELSDDSGISDEDLTVSSADETETTNEEDISQTDDISNSDAVIEDEQVQDEGFSDAGDIEAEELSDDSGISDEDLTVSSTDEEEIVSEEDISQTDDISNSDAVIEDEQVQADNAPDAEINSEDGETLQDQEPIEGQSEEIASDINSDDENTTDTEEEEVSQDKEASNEDVAIDDGTTTDNEEGVIAEEAGEAITAEESIKEEVATENNTAEDVITAEEETTVEETQPPEVDIDILFSTDENGYILVGNPISFSSNIEGVAPYSYIWDFGDGTTTSEVNPSHIYNADGNYKLSLQIAGDDGNTYVKSATVNVSDYNPNTTEYYVSDTGSDENDGLTQDSSFKTVSAVLSHIVNGDTLYILPGTYNEQVDLNEIGSGTEGLPINFIGYDNVVFDGQSVLDHAFYLTTPKSYLGIYNFSFINYLDSAIYIDNQEVTNIDIVDNTFAKNGTAIDVTMDSDLNIENNTVVDNNVGIDISSDNANVEHNIVVDNSKGIKVDETRDNVTVDYNDVYNNQIDYIGTEPGENDISVDPIFTDKEALDFSLQEDSPLLNSNIIRIVQTDKEDYRYNEQVIITGSGYSPNQELILKILRPDGTFVNDITLTTDSDGSFIYNKYAVDYPGKNYLIKIISTDGDILEVLSFTDATTYYVSTVGNDATDVGSSGNPWKTIQYAIDNATGGDTIIVVAGTYNENITINKKLTLQGENNETTIIQSTLDGCLYSFGGRCYGGDRIAIIESSNVTISGFTISGYTSTQQKRGSTSWGIYAWGSSASDPYSKINILDNIFTFYTQGGIRLGNVDGGTISGNTFQQETRSIWYDPRGPEPGSYVDRTYGGSGPELWHCNNIEIDSNIIETDGVGMFLYDSSNITIENNTVSATDTTNPSDAGIHIQSSDNINVQENTISNFTAGEKKYYNNGTNGAGINIISSTNCTIEENTLNNNTVGILVRGAAEDSNIFINNNNLENNTDFGVLNCSTWVGKDRTYTEATASIDATLNWWNDESGPAHASNPDGSGDAVSSNVDYSPWLGATYDTSPMTWYTNDSIQDAIDAAVSGDTINVAAGNYTENVDVNEQVTIIGAGAANTIVTAADYNRHVFEVNANGVIIKDLTATGANKEAYASSLKWRSGVFVKEVDNCTIDGVTAKDNNVGIYLYKSDGSTITGCTATNNQISGIFLNMSNGNEITSNTADANIARGGLATQSVSGIGIRLKSSSNNQIIGNTANSNKGGSQYSGIGIYLDRCPTEVWQWTPGGWEITYFSPNVLTGNTANENEGLRDYDYSGVGILLWQSGGTSDNKALLSGNIANGNTYAGTTREKSGSGIVLYQTHYADVIDNTVNENQKNGFYSEGAIGNFVHDNIVTDNTATGNSIGFYLVNDASTYTNNTISDNTADGVRSDSYGGMQVTATFLNYNNISGNVNYGVNNIGTDLLNAKYNYWDDDSGPTHTLNPGGTGDTVSDNVDFDPWLGAAATTETTGSGYDYINAKDEVGVTVEKTGTGNPTITVAKYSDNPGSGFTNDLGVYTDLHIDDATNVDQIIFRMYYTHADVAEAGLQEETLKAKWWDGSNWIECLNQTINTVDNYIEITITPSTTSPSLSDLVGTAFAASGKTVSPPVISAIFCSNTNPKPDEVVTFSADVTSKFSISSYSWDFGDGSSGSGASVDHAYKKAGKYTVTLTVTNIYGNTDVKSIDVNVVTPVVKEKPPVSYIEVLGIEEEVILPEAGPNRDFLNIAILVISSVLSLLLIIKVMLGSKKKPNF